MRSGRSKAGFLSLGTVDIWGFVVERRPGPSRVFNSIPGLYPLDACSIPHPPSCDSEKWL